MTELHRFQAKALEVVGGEYMRRAPSLDVAIDPAALTLVASASDHERISAEIGIPAAAIPSFLESISIDLGSSDALLRRKLDMIRSGIDPQLRRERGIDEIRILTTPLPVFQALATAPGLIVVNDIVVRERAFNAAMAIFVSYLPDEFPVDPSAAPLRAALRRVALKASDRAPLFSAATESVLLGQAIHRFAEARPDVVSEIGRFAVHLLDFIVAHELGHHVAGHLQSPRQGTPNDWEGEADAFAAEVLRAMRGHAAMAADRLYVLIPIAIGLLELDSDIGASVRETRQNPEDRPQWFERMGQLSVRLGVPSSDAFRDFRRALLNMEAIWSRPT